MPRCGYVKHRLEYFSFYVQKHVAHLVPCSGPPAGSRRTTRGARISETRLFLLLQTPTIQCRRMSVTPNSAI